MDKKTIKFLSNVFLFRGVEDDALECMLKTVTPETKKYASKEVVISPRDYERRLAFVVSGECTVERVKNNGTSIPMNTLKAFDSFGIISLFSTDEEYPTSVVAKRGSELIFFSKSDVDTLIKNSHSVAMNVINFLADRISFLNLKIATFSSDTVEEKLVNFLINSEKKYGSTFDFNCKKTAEAINSGRASLYRALSSLEEKGIIKLENKIIIINDLHGLERILK